MDPKMLEVLACPECKSTLSYDRRAQELICKPCLYAFPIRDGIPVLLIDEARKFDGESA